jgi:type IV pilus assembly protein PilM
MATLNRNKPRIACEIAYDRIFAARMASSGDYVDAFTSRPLSTQSLAPGLTSANILNADGLRQAVSSALEPLVGRNQDIVIVLPDASVRVVLLDFDTLPERHDEAVGLIRYRLKKSLPFDPEHAPVSYHAQRVNGGLKVVAAVAPAEVISDYERVFADMGYSPGVVMPSTLAALGGVDAERPTLVIKIDGATTTIALLNHNAVLLYRTLENPHGVTHPAQLAEDVYPSLVFFHDTYGSEVERMLIGGQRYTPEIGAALESGLKLRMQELVSERHVGNNVVGESVPRAALAAVVGALVA